MTTTETIDPFSFDRLYGDEKYSLQNMELKSVNFPATVEPGKATAVWSDRINTEWYEAQKLIVSQYTGDAFFAGATNDSLLEFGKAIAKAINFKHEVTGVRVSRHTNGASGYPVLLVEITSGGKGIRRTTVPKLPTHFDHFRNYFGDEKY